MKRLTFYDSVKEEYGAFMHDSRDCFLEVETNKRIGNVVREDINIIKGKFIERLAEYENLELTPSEIKDILCKLKNYKKESNDKINPNWVKKLTPSEFEMWISESDFCDCYSEVMPKCNHECFNTLYKWLKK